MSDFLDSMARLSAERVAAATVPSAADLDKPLRSMSLGSFDIIAEIKERSPSEGALVEQGRHRLEQASLYQQGGAAAISVLTEPSRFAGELQHLEEVAAAVSIPAMRKDFLVDPVQILEARAAGASGVLLIVAMLDDINLHRMLDCAWEHSMFVLLESFDADDLERTASLLEQVRHADKAGARQLLVGINTRNLRTLEVDGDRLRTLADLLPSAAASVAESGLLTSADAGNAKRMGYDLGLVGTALMRSEKPKTLLADMLAAGRRS